MLRRGARRETGSRKGCGNLLWRRKCKKMKKTRILDSLFEQKRVNSRLFGPIFDGIQLKVVYLGAAALGFPPLRAIPMKLR
jgi:hypothetical protein